MELIRQAEAWLEQDPDVETRNQLSALISSGDISALASCFKVRLSFGTAGLRGELGPGPGRMNQLVVAQTALAIARYLRNNSEDFVDANGQLSVLIGHDARIKSDLFAQESAEILAGQGIRVLKFKNQVATPIVAFTGRRLQTSASIMVTASHNPRGDNGYKVYLGGANGGSQLISPADTEIAKLINDVAQRELYRNITKSTNIELLDEDAINAYLDRALELEPRIKSDIAICYTAMHGVGWRFISKLFQLAEFSNIASVPSQEIPDGKFPTLPFPNPEEPGALDLALKHAKATGCSIILATDPDADRLAVVVKKDDLWTALTGDQVGLLLGQRVASRTNSGTLATTIVSLQLLERLAEETGLKFESTLTGFKWISKVPNLIFGYEEALGYCIDPSNTPDKDGITAALSIATLAGELAVRGETLLDELERLFQKYGYAASRQRSFRMESTEAVRQAMEFLRGKLATSDLGRGSQIKDWLLGDDASRKTDALEMNLNGVRIVFRPSGTEPKLKCYMQSLASGSLEAAEKLDAVLPQLDQLMDEFIDH